MKKKKVVYQSKQYTPWKKHHIEYLRQNAPTTPLIKIAEDLRDMRLSNVWEGVIERKCIELGINYLKPSTEELKKETAKRKNRGRQLQIKKKEDELMERIKEITAEYYPTGGGRAVVDKLKTIGVYYSLQQIHYRARKWGVVRDQKKPPPKPTKPHRLPLSQSLQNAYYIVEAFNERNATNFDIYGRKDGSGEVVDRYLSLERGERIMVELIGLLFIAGYKLQKSKGVNMRFYIWGE